MRNITFFILKSKVISYNDVTLMLFKFHKKKSILNQSILSVMSNNK